MEYPEEIYATRDGGLLSSKQRKDAGSGWGRRHAYDLGHEAGYAKCLAEQADPLAGYSNLTAAISAGESIDWERLGGLEVQCVHTDMGTLRGKMDRDTRYYTNKPRGWWISGGDNSYINAFCSAWNGTGGWTLWVEGDIPLTRKTADQLKVGTYFQGSCHLVDDETMYVGKASTSGEKIIRFAPSMLESEFPATEWEVLEEHGPFQKPEGK